MNELKNTDNWDDLFGKLGQLTPVEPAPFFYTRVRARLERNQQTASSWLLRPAYAIAGLMLLVLLNLTIAFSNPSTESISTESTTYDGFVAEYHLLQFNWDTNE